MSALFEPTPQMYDALIDWPKRLAAETPLYRRLFEAVGARRVLDAACGSGRHAALFHAWGLEVEGADASGAMIEHCRRQHGVGDRLRWVVRAFEDRPTPEGQFDAVICVGNSLALAADHAAVARGLAALLSAVRPGGRVLVQVVNLWRLQPGPTHWQRILRVDVGGRDMFLLKGMHRCGETGFVEFLALEPGPGHEFRSTVNEGRFLGLTADELHQAAIGAGGRVIETLGSVQGDPYDPGTSPDLIIIATR